ncbi:MAG: hypothetical protein JSU63_12160 [Phycisphaerales bacterium]|nr:MAG: hypothetical protein JSU63_12160 [Phycisphaerales bacterium]
MTSSDEQKREIEQNERWFRRVCQDSVGPDTERIKQRVAVELSEQWLKKGLSDEIPTDLAERVKRRLWATLAADRCDAQQKMPALPKRGGARRAYRLAGAFGAVAAACVFAFIGLHFAKTDVVKLPVADAFEQYDEDDFLLALADLDDDLTELEISFYSFDAGGGDDYDYDGLLDTIDGLMSDDEAFDDWSWGDEIDEQGVKRS